MRQLLRRPCSRKVLTNLPSGHAVQTFEEIDSTNLEAARQFRQGHSAPTWFLTRRQSAGYGRRGRVWSQAEGDFAGSLLLPVEATWPADRLALISFTAALGLDRALQALDIPADDIGLKWPNDVLLNGAKVAGILLELIEHENNRALVVGIGVNIVSAPDVAEYKTAKLSDSLSAEQIPSTEAFLERLDASFNELTDDLLANGFEHIRKDWLGRACNLGDQITVRLPKQEVSGLFEGIDPAGALILKNETGLHHITSGDVFFPSVS